MIKGSLVLILWIRYNKLVAIFQLVPIGLNFILVIRRKYTVPFTLSLSLQEKEKETLTINGMGKY